MIYVLTGNGKGKTTSAIGMGVRGAGAGKKVLMIQFLKTESSENKIIEKIKNFDVRLFGRKGFFVSKSYLKTHLQLRKIGVREATKKDYELVKKGFNLAERAVKSKKYSILILDEICVVLKLGFLDKKEVLGFLRENQKKIDIVLTGRQCPKRIIEIADLVTGFKEVKHYYQKGVKSRKGIEY